MSGQSDDAAKTVFLNGDAELDAIEREEAEIKARKRDIYSRGKDVGISPKTWRGWRHRKAQPDPNAELEGAIDQLQAWSEGAEKASQAPAPARAKRPNGSSGAHAPHEAASKSGDRSPRATDEPHGEIQPETAAGGRETESGSCDQTRKGPELVREAPGGLTGAPGVSLDIDAGGTHHEPGPSASGAAGQGPPTALATPDLEDIPACLRWENRGLKRGEWIVPPSPDDTGNESQPDAG